MIWQENNPERFSKNIQPRDWIRPWILRADDSERHAEVTIETLVAFSQIEIP